MRSASYSRVSTEEQARGTSIGAQRDATRAYIESQGWTMVGEYSDEGVSGANRSRSGLDELMRACRNSEVDVIVVSKLDRWGRDLGWLFDTFRDFDRLGVEMHSLAEGSMSDNTSSGRLHRNMLSMFADFERDRIRERMMEGLRRTAELGGWSGGPPPFGYKIVEVNRRKILQPDRDREAATIERAVELAVDHGMTAYQIAARLNDEGLPPRIGVRWSYPNLRRTINSPTLVGRHVWAKHTDDPVRVQFEPLISVERWEAARRALRLNSGRIHREKRHYLLRSRLTSICGHRMWGVFRKDRDRSHYKCQENFTTHRAGDRSCGCRALPTDELDAIVWETVSSVLSQPDWLLDQASAYIEQREKTAGGELEQLDELEPRIANLESAIADRAANALKAGLDPEAIRQAVLLLEDELREARRWHHQLTTLQQEQTGQSERMRRLSELAERTPARLGKMSTQDRRTMLAILDIRVAVIKQGDRRTPPHLRISGAVAHEAIDFMDEYTEADGNNTNAVLQAPALRPR